MTSIERLGKYKVVREIGRGAMGVVYEGFDTAIERTVALKVLQLERGNDAAVEEARLRFKREVQSAGRLNHPNIVTVYDYGEAADPEKAGLEGPFMAMEFVQGRDLKQLLQSNRRFSSAEIGRLMQQLLAALQHAHDHGVVHRDVKPSNVMLCPGDVVKLADFGIARIDRSELTVSGAVLGSAAYMAPEQLTGSSVDHRADVYAAGALLYELLTGEPPFLGSTTSVIQKILNQTALPPSIANPLCQRSLDAVLGRALAKRPDERFASADSFAKAIAAALEQPDADATVVRRDGQRMAAAADRQAPPPPHRWSSRRWPALAASAAVILGTVLVVWRLLPDPTAADRTAHPQLGAVGSSTTESPAAAARSTAEGVPARPTDRLVALVPADSGTAPRKVDPPPASLDKPASSRTATRAPRQPTAPAAKSGSSVPERSPSAPASAAGSTKTDAPPLPGERGAVDRMIDSCPGKAGQDGRDCRLRIADFYREGRVVSRDYPAAMRWYRSGAELGDPEAQYQLARAYFLGRGTAQNHADGLPWLKRAADQGNAGAENLLGYAFERGLGVPIDRAAAVDWYKKASAKGHAPGQNNLGRAYLYGIGLAPDAAKAAALLRSASASGDANAAFNLGAMFAKGIGVAPSNEQAAAWYRTAFARPGLNLWSAQEADHARAVIASQVTRRAGR